MKYYLLALFLGAISPLGFAPYDIWPLVFISISGLIYLINSKKTKNYFLMGFFFGIGFWGVGVSWVYVSIYYHGNQGFIGSFLITSLFIVYLSLFIGLSTYLFKLFKTNVKYINYLLVFPAAWVSCELLRSHFINGFPWLIMGSSLTGTHIDGWIPILGSYGTSLLLVIMSACLVLIIESTKRIELSPILLLLIIFISSFALNKVNWTKESFSIEASIYQPNFSLQDKWSLKGLRSTKSLIEDAILKANTNEFIFFPETTLITERKKLEPWISNIEKEARKKNISLISGIIASDLSQEGNLLQRYNRIQGFGSASGYYDKIQLVPFGEYIPFRKSFGEILDFMGINLIDTLKGQAYSTIKSGSIKISPSICYEIAFPNLVRKTAKNSDLLVTISNDTWFGRSIGPEQHLEIAQTRALEHQKSLIRATNSGISAIISREGKIEQRQNYFEEKNLEGKVMIYEGQTPYSLLGNMFIYVFLLLCYMYLIYYKRTNVT